MTMRADWLTVKRTLQAALELPESDRSAYLDEVCGSDPDLRSEVERLLSADQERVRFLEQPAGSLLAEVDDSLEGQHIGPYLLVRTLGSGGLGSVYLAVRDDEEFQHEVAIKVLKRGMDTDEIVHRFKSERQILANLDHPNITRLFEGGSTDDGRPFFVMEYVEGEPLGCYCNNNALSLTDRLRLFRKICSAVHFAHQNLIVHRDLKPSNILVTASGEPKLLDFGIAKLLSHDPSRPHTVTGTRHPLMTPEYASPEQATGAAITTASDVYSLGVLLYELLTGCRPYHFKSRSAEETCRVLSEEEPEKPSVVITRREEILSTSDMTLKGTLRSMRQTYGSDPATLRRRLSGDLDTIVLMALRKDPQRRYRSAEQFSDDIQRHLQKLPVRAQKDTYFYRSRKFLRRHRSGVATAALILLLICASAIAVIFQQQKTAQQRDRAELVSQFLVDLFDAANPQEPEGPTTARDLLDEGAKRIETELQNQPEVRAEVMETIANAYSSLGFYDRAQSLLQEALEIRELMYGADSFRIAETCHSIGHLAYLTGDYSTAETLLRRALGIYGESENLNEEIAGAANSLGLLYKKQGNYAAAEPLYQRALALQSEEFGEGHGLAASILNNLAALYKTQGRYAEAEEYYKRALTIKETKLGVNHSKVAITLKNLGVLYKVQGRVGEAEEFYRRALAIEERALGAEHPSVALTLNNLAVLYHTQERYLAAEPLHERALAIREQKLGIEHPKYAESLHNLATLYHKQGKVLLAEDFFLRALEIRETQLGEHHRTVAITLSNLGQLHLDQGDYEQAESLLFRSLAIREKAFGEDHIEVAESLAKLARLYHRQGKVEIVRSHSKRVVEIYKRALGPDHETTIAHQADFASLLDAQSTPSWQ